MLDCPAVGNHVSFEPEIFSQTIGQPILAASDRHAIKVVVRTHHAEQAALFDRRSEWRQENVFNFTRRNLRIGARLAAARAFRSEEHTPELQSLAYLVCR